MNLNFIPHDRHVLRRFAADLARALSLAFMVAAAPFVGLVFIVLLPTIWLVLLIALACSGSGRAATTARTSTTPSNPRSVRFAFRP